MTSKERIELLKKVAEVAPEEWQAHENNDWEWLTFWVPTGEYDRELPPNPYIDICDLVLYDDMRSASAIIAMIDAIEKDGWTTNLHTGVYCLDPDEDWLDTEGFNFSVWKLNTEIDFNEFGDTRVEAVAKAFVQVFSDKPHKLQEDLKTGDDN